MKQGSNRLGVFNGIILTLNLLFVTALLLSYLSVHISPANTWILPFFGLGYPILLLINLFFMLYWMLRKRWIFLISAIVIALGWSHVERTVQFRAPQDKPFNAKAFQVLTYNVKNLSNDNVNLLDPDVRNRIIGYLDDKDPDLLCMQEFSIVHPNPEAFLDTLSDRLNLPFHAYSQYIEKASKRIDALFIFSRFPILKSGALRKDNLHNYAIFADVLIENDTVRIFNIHLESIRLRQEDYKFISELDQRIENKDNVKENSQRILGKLKTAYIKRAAQVDSLSVYLARSPYPVILCGDFNDAPNSYAYQKLRTGLTDSFLESGYGFGNTYIGNLPSYRIDNIFYGRILESWAWRRDKVNFSDHYPVSCYVGFRKDATKEAVVSLFE